MLSTLGIVAASSAAALIGHHYLTKPAPFHVDVDQPTMKVAGINIFPIIHKIFSFLPESTRQNMAIKKTAPHNIPKDRFDLSGESPYTVSELVKDKLWKVSFEHQFPFASPFRRKQFADLSGMDFNSPLFENKLIEAARIQGSEFVEVVKNDLLYVRELMNRIDCNLSTVKDLPYFTLNMFIFKMKNGALLLYAPVMIRDEFGFAEWLNGLGKVEWIVIASSFHTTYIRSVMERYPEAKVVGSENAEKKIRVVMGDIPRGGFDYISTNTEDLCELNKVLSDQDVQFFSTVGDVAVNALFVRAGEALLECDVVYGHADGQGALLNNKEDFLKLKPKHWFDRIFKFGLINKPNSPHGFLPNYRYNFMDPNSFGGMQYQVPSKDGLDCKRMANSLREVLQMDFKSAHGVHISDMTRDEYCKSVDKCWNWLDGKSLIEE